MRTRLQLLAALAPLLLAACASWQPARRSEAWTLYVQSGSQLELEPYERALAAAHPAVESHLGPFRRPVRVHVWDGGVEMQSGNRGEIRHGGEGLQDEIPGIGPARVRAFHTSGASPFRSSGVFLGTADAGTAVHELVHARLAEGGPTERMPLWFEEGYATLLGDGLLTDAGWVVDGLATWPWRELHGEPLADEDLTRLMAIGPRDDHSVRENVLLHFLGWAIVFDLHRELGTLDWRPLLARFEQAEDPHAEARRRMGRTLERSTPVEWLDERAERSPAERLAAVKGTWKLHSRAVALWMLDRLEVERDAEVRAALAVNALATAGQTRMPWSLQAEVWRAILPVLRDTELPDESERDALRRLYRAYAQGTGKLDAEPALAALARFWED